MCHMVPLLGLGLGLGFSSALFNVLSIIAKNACQQLIDQQNFTIIEKHMHKAKNCIFQKESYKIVGTFSKVQQ